MRVIARLDIKNEYVIKGIHLEGLRKVGRPNDLALKYYESGVDEIFFMDAVASLYDRNSLFEIISEACKNIFVPLTLGGGIRSISDIENALFAGADKVAINTAAVKSPNLINEASRIYGSQCLIGSIEAKKNVATNSWEAYIDNGREQTGLNVVEWAKKLEQLGVGEILMTSVDMEGTKRGFDVELFETLASETCCPVVVSGGYGKAEHLHRLCLNHVPSGVAFASVLHYEKENVCDIKEFLRCDGVEVRP